MGPAGTCDGQPRRQTDGRQAALIFWRASWADRNLENLDGLVHQAAEGAFNYHVVRNCPFDCPIPKPLKRRAAEMINAFDSGQEI